MAEEIKYAGLNTLDYLINNKLALKDHTHDYLPLTAAASSVANKLTVAIQGSSAATVYNYDGSNALDLGMLYSYKYIDDLELTLTGRILTVENTLDGKSDTGHTHLYAGSSSAGGAANSVKTNLIIKFNGGSTEGTNLFTFNGSNAKTVNITPGAIGAVAATNGSVGFSWTAADSEDASVGDTTTAQFRLFGGSPNQALGIVTTNGSTTLYHTIIDNYGKLALMPLKGGTFTGDVYFNSNPIVYNGKYMQWYNSSGRHVSLIVLTSSNTFNVGNTDYATNINGSAITLKATSGAGVQVTSTTLKPDKSNAYSLGSKNYLFSTVYAKTSTINTSDELEKDILEDGITEAYENWFLELEPILYKWKQFDWEGHVPDRIHCGLGARKTLEIAEKHGLSAMDIAAICYDDFSDEPLPDGRTERYGMRYGELHGMEIHMIQKLFKENQELKERIEKLESVA